MTESHGIVWGGPHDSVWDSVITFQNGTSDDGHAGMYIRYNSNMQGGRLQILNSHSWGNSQSWAIKSEATLSTTNTQWEGAQRAQVLLTGSDASHAATDTVIQNDVLYAAGVIANPVGLELGATSPAAVTITGLQGWLKIITFFWTASGAGGFSVATAAVLTISTTYFINYIVVG